jgi:hypothetical protein
MIPFGRIIGIIGFVSWKKLRDFGSNGIYSVQCALLLLVLKSCEISK